MNAGQRIWVVDDDVALRTILQDSLSDMGYNVITFGNGKIAWQNLEKINHINELPNVILTDIRMPMMDGLALSEKIKTQFGNIPVIVMTAHSDVQSAVDSYQTGAFDYLPKPFDLDEMLGMVNKALTYNVEKMDKNHQNDMDNHDDVILTMDNSDVVKNDNADDTNISGIIGKSPAMQTVFRAIGRLSNIAMTVLITGESGSGKEMIANALHEHSPRKNKPFIALNMAAIPHDLIESELFGHEKGAFTGATATRQGRFEQAHGGTLFLDEIGDMPLSTQTRLLRVLANGEFFRIGGQKPIKVDVRIIAATHQDLENLVKQGKFREDLFYRLNVIRLNLPALRERQEDIPLLCHFFMQKIAKSMQLPVKNIQPDAMQALQNYGWQGNVRQLENTCRWLMVMATGNDVHIDDLPPDILAQVQLSDNLEFHSTYNFNENNLQNSQKNLNNQLDKTNEKIIFDNKIVDNKIDKDVKTDVIYDNDFVNADDVNDENTDWQTPLKNWTKQALAQGKPEILQQALPMFETQLLQTTLDFTNQHKGKTAELLGWGRNTLTRKYQQLIDNKDDE